MEMILVAKRNRIKELLEQQGQSIYWLANEVGMSYQAIHKLANSEMIPGGTAWDTLRKVAEALGVGVNELEENGNGQ